MNRTIIGVTRVITQAQKSETIKNFKQNEKDTGSMQVQVALFTERINALNEHFKKHAHDNASKRGLMKLVSQRRTFLSYLQKHDEAQYKKLIERLGIRK